jgi:hypothetical protein
MGLCIETDDMYIITEFITGGDLRSKLKDKSVEMDWKLRVGKHSPHISLFSARINHFDRLAG